MGNNSTALYWIPLLPLIGALINLLIGRKLPRWMVHFIAIAAVAASFGVVLSMFITFDFTRILPFKAGPLYELFKHRAPGQAVELNQRLYRWIEVGDFKVDIAFRLDTLSATMCAIVTGVGTLIHIYSTGYMAEEPRYATYFGYLNLFTGAMLILVLGSNMPVMFIGWEGVGLCSYLLIGFWYTNDAYATAGRKAFVVNRIGDFAFLLGMFLLFYATRSLDFADLRHADPHAYTQPFWGGERLAAAAGILLFIGACGKSAQIPLYVWLPDAMAGPTPVSALIHAATMVTAGVYMIARLSFVFAHSTTALIVIATIGMLTAIAAAFMAFAQTDLKKVLAYSTVSQLGFMFVGVGTGNWGPAIFHVGTHAFFKAGLFLGAGSVMHAMSGSGDITKMGGLRKHLPITHATFLIFCLAISGFPLLSGWFSKDALLAGSYASLHEGWPTWYRYVLWSGLTVAALGTAVYMWRLYFLVFAGDCRADAETQAHIHESPPSMTVVLLILAFFTVTAGVLGLPHVFHVGGAAEMLDQWLAPSVSEIENGHLGEARVWELLGIATFVGLGGIFIAYRLWGNGPSARVAKWTAGEGKPLYEASLNKLWVDEFYDLILVRPFRWLANGLFVFVDRFLIDTVLVEGPARVLGLFGRVMRWVQNGQVQRYMVGLILGAALIFFLAGRASEPAVRWHRVPAGIELDAYPGSGLQSTAAHLRWDLTGDGEWDLRPEASERMASERAGEPTSNWFAMMTALQQGHVKLDPRDLPEELPPCELPQPGAPARLVLCRDPRTKAIQGNDLGQWSSDQVFAFLRDLPPSRLRQLIESTQAPKDAKDRYAAYLTAVAPQPGDYVSDPTLVKRAGEVGPVVRLEIADGVTGKTHVVSTRIP